MSYWVAAFFIIGGGLFLFSLIAWSPFPLTVSDALSVFGVGDPSRMTRIIERVRLPRSLVALLLGGLLGLCGALMQGVSRNPLASPTLLGVTGGASLGLALTTSGVIALSIPAPFAAMIGGAIAWALVMALGTAWSVDASRTRLVLAGMTMAALCAGLTRLVVLLAEERALGVLNWLAGSLANTDFSDVRLLLVATLIALPIAAFVARPLNLVALGDETAQALGVRLVSLRLSVFTLGCVLTGLSVAIAGPIGFLGLIAPNVARALVGADHRALLPMSAALGSIMLLLADITGRAVAFPAETPAGAITALVGAPVFLLLARRLK